MTNYINLSDVLGWGNMTGEEVLEKLKILAKRDKPMEIVEIGFNSPGMMTAHCPNCNCYIDAVPPRHIYNYCWNCGQSLEWRDEYDVDGIKLTFERTNAHDS